MIVFMVSRDIKVLNVQSTTFKRMKEYSDLFEGLYIFPIGNKKVDTLDIDDDKLHVYNTSSFFIVFSVFKVIFKFLKTSKNIDKKDLWITSQDPFETGLVAYIVSRITKAKLQLQVHTDFLHPLFSKESLLNKFRVFVAKKILPYAQKIRVVSEGIRQSLISGNNLKLDNSKIVTLPIFIDQDKILREPIHHNLRDKFPAKFVVLMVCRLEIEKNIQLAIRAFKKFLIKKPEAVLVIAGDGSQRKVLQKMVNENNLSQKVYFLGFVEEVYSLYKTADVLLITSDYEGYGMNMVEARICNCPVVSTDVGVAKEIGATIVPRDEESISGALDNISGEQKHIQLIDSVEYNELFKNTFA